MQNKNSKKKTKPLNYRISKRSLVTETPGTLQEDRETQTHDQVENRDEEAHRKLNSDSFLCKNLPPTSCIKNNLNPSTINPFLQYKLSYDDNVDGIIKEAIRKIVSVNKLFKEFFSARPETHKYREIILVKHFFKDINPESMEKFIDWTNSREAVNAFEEFYRDNKELENVYQKGAKISIKKAPEKTKENLEILRITSNLYKTVLRELKIDQKEDVIQYGQKSFVDSFSLKPRTPTHSKKVTSKKDNKNTTQPLTQSSLMEETTMLNLEVDPDNELDDDDATKHESDELSQRMPTLEPQLNGTGLETIDILGNQSDSINYISTPPSVLDREKADHDNLLIPEIVPTTTAPTPTTTTKGSNTTTTKATIPSTDNKPESETQLSQPHLHNNFQTNHNSQRTFSSPSAFSENTDYKKNFRLLHDKMKSSQRQGFPKANTEDRGSFTESRIPISQPRNRETNDVLQSDDENNQDEYAEQETYTEKVNNGESKHTQSLTTESSVFSTSASTIQSNIDQQVIDTSQIDRSTQLADLTPTIPTIQVNLPTKPSNPFNPFLHLDNPSPNITQNTHFSHPKQIFTATPKRNITESKPTNQINGFVSNDQIYIGIGIAVFCLLAIIIVLISVCLLKMCIKPVKRRRKAKKKNFKITKF
ncbi:hypothetical protein TUBRATIS_24250 [Tubulinosema ratisbonensis]|uniref:Uncharacterized protein n=1 Tax=Tubulinosema ratisbonensis TaxID=291195 RepID=A0A437AJC7_9MICR|nr:hypothetical protein TUBRATIS_24250 [Tubulinosema ratisbonensis]